ncbi:hypothetical protein DL240_18990 [Lujinxingia litoralis]|uniref:Uncharacterized protein n=1 Tax=Lujinxingia litoralis TaxID=2211119 RepID=A0A328C4V2_9DELT|nr:hypothetical protein [Lujinxingia litoralis]RAL20050.1 hypothetical protein DL240_18990 [Lujinxingia litoralis]
MDLVDLIETRRFLGSEFMMWLWFKSESYDGLMEVAEHGDIEVLFDDALVLEAYLAETERNTFKGGAPAYSPEAKVALQQGKRVSRAKIRVIKDGREWLLTLKAEGMDFSSVKIPAVLSREEDEKFYERMYLVEELEDIIAALYRTFIFTRLSPGWHDAMVPAMKEWIMAEEGVPSELYPAQAEQSGPAVAKSA